MDIILKQDVTNLGYKNDIVTVKPGYGRNYLIPQGLAILATERNRKILAEEMRQQAHKEEKIKNEALDKAKALELLGRRQDASRKGMRPLPTSFFRVDPVSGNARTRVMVHSALRLRSEGNEDEEGVALRVIDITGGVGVLQTYRLVPKQRADKCVIFNEIFLSCVELIQTCLAGQRSCIGDHLIVGRIAPGIALLPGGEPHVQIGQGVHIVGRHGATGCFIVALAVPVVEEDTDVRGLQDQVDADFWRGAGLCGQRRDHCPDPPAGVRML